jgi:predicted Abi (CAAX) family protease
MNQGGGGQPKSLNMTELFIAATTVHHATSSLWNVMLRHFVSTMQWLMQGGKHSILVSDPGHRNVKVKGHDP